jgi:NitT/TauT family transport system ATP-binding protein
MQNDQPSYLQQSDAVKARFDKLKQREVILEVQDLTKVYRSQQGETTALSKVSFKTHRREFVCVIGPSGCGKSTLIRILAGLEGYSGGQVLLDGKPVTGPGRDRGMVFQGYTLFPWLTVRKNVMFGLEMNGLPHDEAAREADLWLELVGLEKFAKAYPHQLSGGMKQRVASPAPWSTSRASCSWTSRSVRSTHRRAARCRATCSISGATWM